ncbi:MAG: SDR family oxidoreductase [Rhodobiaceae bacterium]|nr:SDR family oxidoreductase [Rhodobiaceae bacterium]MCC0056877.1 SDR family oxidoreductase [Rhodobiaceae bacterium]
MNILLLGAGGFIGRHVLAELLSHGHRVDAIVRRDDGLGSAFPQARIHELDLIGMTSEVDWHPRLAGIDVVVNAAGMLRGPAMHAIHVAMPEALYAACGRTGVKRVVLLSAISARPDVETDYARTKLQGEAALRAADVQWTILRPSLVYGDGSYGGTSLLRGMAALPWRVPVPGAGDQLFSPVHVDDLARAIRIACEDDALAAAELEPVGPRTLTLAALLDKYRRWLGFGHARFVSVPMLVMNLVARLGDVFGNGPVSTNSLKQLVAGNAGDGQSFATAIGFSPRSLDDALHARPASVQDRWHARLFFLPALLTAVLALTWIASALLGLFFGAAYTRELASALSLPESWILPLQIAGSAIDFVVAALMVFDRKGRWSTPLQLAVVSAYTALIGIALPHLWLDPLGSLLKNFAFMALVLVHGAIADRR